MTRGWALDPVGALAQRPVGAAELALQPGLDLPGPADLLLLYQRIELTGDQRRRRQ